MATEIPQPTHRSDGLAIYDLGAGEPILLMPGPHRYQQIGDGSAAALWQGLRKLGRRVISFDPPGAGYSTRPARLSMAEMQQCTLEALSVCAITQPIDALGHSMAGLVLLAFAIEQPAQIRRLILVGTGSGGPAYMHAPGALWNRSHPNFAQVAVLGILHTLWPSLASQKLLFNLIERKSYHNQRLVQLEQLSPADWMKPKIGFSHWHQIASRLDYRAQLSQIRVPTLIICGRHDPQYPPACSLELAERLPHSQLHYMEQSGHFPFSEEPEQFWPVVAHFLDNNPW